MPNATTEAVPSPTLPAMPPHVKVDPATGPMAPFAPARAPAADAAVSTAATAPAAAAVVPPPPPPPAEAASGMTTPSAMGVSFCPATRVFRLQTRSTVYVMRISDARGMEHLYYGPSLGTEDDLTYLASANVGQPLDAQWRAPLLTPAGAASAAALDGLRGRFPSVTGAATGGGQRVLDGERHPLDAAATAALPVFPPATVTVASSSSSSSGASSPSGSSQGSSDSLLAAVDGVPGSLPSVGGSAGLGLSGSFTDGTSFLDALDGPPRVGGGAWPAGAASSVSPAAAGGDRDSPPSVVSEVTLPTSCAEEGVADWDLLRAKGVTATATATAAAAAARTHALSPLDGGVEATVVDRFSATNWAELDPSRVGNNSRLFEFGSCGTGDYRSPSLGVLFADGSSSVALEYVSHRVVAGKALREDASGAALPAVYVDSPDEATTLTLELADPDTGLVVELHYAVMHEYDIITRWTTVRNHTLQPVVLERLSSAMMDMEAAPSRHLTSLGGTWGRERQVMVRKLLQGTSSFGSTRGGSSHQHSPFLAVSSGGAPAEETGDVVAMTLVYSGNFEANAEVNEQGRVRVSMGVHPEGFRWTLPRGGLFASPEVLLTASDAGTGTVSRRLHRLIRERLTPRQWRSAPRPVLLNTWEANYFDVSHTGVMEIAQAAVDQRLGVDTVVLDDGWFSRVGRPDAKSGLGDWFPNKDKVRFAVRA